MKRRFPLPLALAACLVLSTPALADTIYLKNGQKFEGKVIVKGDQIILISETGSRLPFPKDRVDRVVRGPAPWEIYAGKVAKVKAGDAAGHLELAKWCRTKKLYKRAAKHFGAVIKAQPDHEEAHRLLGHEKVGGTWMSKADALKAKGYVQVKGRWLSPEEYARHQAKNRGKQAAEKELKRLRQLAGADATKAKAARDFYIGRGAKAHQNLIWGLINLKNYKARLECIKLVNQLKPTRKVHSLWLVQAAIRESNTSCVKEICKGVKSRNDTVAMTYLVLYAAGGSNSRRKAAYCLRLVHDKRAYQALVGCIARAPKNTLPGGAGMSLSQMGNYAKSSRSGGGLSMGGGEVVPAADSMEYISGKSYKNDVGKWVKWIESLDKAPGGAVIDVGKK
jgi:hypothetical protein